MRASSKASRRGAIVVLAALFMIVLLGMVAFSVDIGYITTTRGELQTVADAAALAGASQLASHSILNSSQDPAITAARLEAQRFGLSNSAAGVPIVLAANAENNADGAIVIGALSDPNDPNATLDLAAPFANAVSVNARRTTAENGELRLFFAAVLGTRTAQVAASATAGFETRINGFEISGNNPAITNSKLLPFALDVNAWNELRNGTGADVWTRNSQTGAITSGGDGIPETNLYGANQLTTANWGTVNIGQENNSTNDIARQILHGPNKSDFEVMGGSFELDADGTRIVSGDPGLSAGFKDELAAIKGQPRVIPLYSAVSGSGSNATYTIVGFAGITITDVRLTGRNKSVTIQPEVVVDPTAIGGGSWSSSSSAYVYGPVSLVR